jgi:rhodanese-related sulfurtransferase
MARELEIEPRKAEELRRKPGTVLIDVREPEEYALARIEASRLIPMQAVPAQLQQIEALADEGAVLLLCHHGVRSLQVAAWLRQQGIENCYSITGGIDRWSAEIDGNVPRY